MIDQVVTRLETELSGVLKSVEAASAFASLTNAPPHHKRPAAFVVPITESYSQNIGGASLVRQKLTQTFGVVLAIDAMPRRKASDDAAAIETLKQAVRDCLVGWIPAPGYEAVEVINGRTQRIQDKVIWWLYQFRTVQLIRSN